MFAYAGSASQLILNQRYPTLNHDVIWGRSYTATTTVPRLMFSRTAISDTTDNPELHPQRVRVVSSGSIHYLTCRECPNMQHSSRARQGWRW